MKDLKKTVRKIINLYVLPWAKAWIAGLFATLIAFLAENGVELPSEALEVFVALGYGLVTFAVTWLLPNKQ